MNEQTRARVTTAAIWALYGYDVDPNDIDPDGADAAAIERIVVLVERERQEAAISATPA